MSANHTQKLLSTRNSAQLDTVPAIELLATFSEALPPVIYRVLRTQSNSQVLLHVSTDWTETLLEYHTEASKLK
jgi:hypothetical protein